MAANGSAVLNRPRVFDLSPRSGDNGWMLFLKELDARATLGTLGLSVAGEAIVRADVELPGFAWVSIEIFDPVAVIDPGGDPRRVRFRPVEFILADVEVADSIVGGFQFDGSDRGRYPGIESGFDRDGRLVRIQVERAGFIGTPGLVA